MTQYLTPRQRQLFLKKLANTDAAEDMRLTPDEQSAALRHGAKMAQADLDSRLNDEDEGSAFLQDDMTTPESDALAERLNALGFDEPEALIEAYERLSRRYADLLRDMRHAEAMSRARKNARLLEPDPSGRNRLIQNEWIRRADALSDLAQFLPDMAGYIAEHPEYAVETDGLERAYDAVRSHLYRSEEQLLDDPQAVKRLSADPRIRESVLTTHLASLYKSAQDLPAFIDDGGSTPGAAPSKGGMDKAKIKLLAMLRE